MPDTRIFEEAIRRIDSRPYTASCLLWRFSSICTSPFVPPFVCMPPARSITAALIVVAQLPVTVASSSVPSRERFPSI